MLKLFTAAFWADVWRALVRTLLAAVIAAVPFILANPSSATVWLLQALTIGFAVVYAIITSLLGLPPTGSGPWWQVGIQRAVRQFAQVVGAGLTGAAILTDIDWIPLLQQAAISAGGTLVIAAFTVLNGGVIPLAVVALPAVPLEPIPDPVEAPEADTYGGDPVPADPAVEGTEGLPDESEPRRAIDEPELGD